MGFELVTPKMSHLNFHAKNETFFVTSIRIRTLNQILKAKLLVDLNQKSFSRCKLTCHKGFTSKVSVLEVLEQREMKKPK